MEALKASLKKSIQDQKSLDSVSCQKSDEVRDPKNIEKTIYA